MKKGPSAFEGGGGTEARDDGAQALKTQAGDIGTLYKGLRSRRAAKYLLCYNVLGLLLWTYALVSTCYAATRQPESAWCASRITVKAATALATLEILHSVLKLTRNDPITVAVQVLSRLQLSWIVWEVSENSRVCGAAPLVVLAWSLSEVLRYPYYVCQVLEINPHPLAKYLRYSGFLALYPVGILGEMFCIAESIKDLSDYPPYPSPMPNRLNFEVSLRRVPQMLLVLYVPGAIKMYSHMLRQRSKTLNPKKTIKTV